MSSHLLPLARSLATLIALGLAAAGCSDRDDPPPGVTPPALAPALTGQVLDYGDEPARGVPVRIRGGASGTTRGNGLLQLGPTSAGAQMLVVGDSQSTPTLLVPFTGTSDPAGAFLERPVYLPSLSSGISANLPASVAALTTVSGDALPGVSLRLAAGTSIAGTQGTIRVVPVSPSRLPVAVRAGTGGASEPRAAFLIEPHGATFTPPATLRLPRLDALARGPFDVHRIDPGSGLWVVSASAIAPVSSDEAFEVAVDQGTLYCVVPRSAPATLTLTGRVLAGTQPVAGYRASCWNRTSTPTGADGAFTIPDVPSAFGAFLVRVHPERPGAAFAPEVVLSAATSAALGDVQVAARPPDTIRPKVRSTSPAEGAVFVPREAQVAVVFSEPIDRAHTRPFKLVGLKGEVAGQYTFDNAFTVRFRPEEVLDPQVTYTILVDRAVSDLEGNALDDDEIAFRFTTTPGPAAAPPTDTLAFGLEPLSAARGETVRIPGRNYTGGSSVVFGSTPGLVRAETSQQIDVEVPDFQPAGDVTVSLSAGGVPIGTLLPLVLDLRAGVAVIYSGTTPDQPLRLLDRALPPSAVIVDGDNVGGASVAIDGVGIASVDSTVLVGGLSVATGRRLVLPAPLPATLLPGPVVLRGTNGRPGRTYRFLLVRE